VAKFGAVGRRFHITHYRKWRRLRARRRNVPRYFSKSQRELFLALAQLDGRPDGRVMQPQAEGDSPEHAQLGGG
jgi:hypothetical protein